MTLKLAWLAIGLFVPILVFFLGVRVRGLAAKLQRVAVVALLAVYIVTPLLLSALSGRKYVIVIALAEMAVTCALLGRTFNVANYAWLCSLFFALLMSWAFTLGFPYTHLADWLLNATASSRFAIPAFILSFALTTYIFVARSRGRDPFVVSFTQFAIAACVFVFLGLRIDNETSIWVPYHQNYFISPASLVRAHHWLLWDVPSQYGFLSVAAIAAMPGRTTFDAMHSLIGAVLLVQAMLVYLALRARRAGWLNFIFALGICCAVFYSSQAQYYPFGARLLPQQGLRFIWPIAVLFFVYCRYRYRAPKAQFWFLVAGYACWLSGVLWSFETGVWTSLTWIAYLVGESVARGFETRNWLRAFVQLAYRFSALIILLAAAAAVIEAIYVHRLGHGPDWFSYIEFGALYASVSAYVVPVNGTGAGWAIAVVLIALAALAIFAIRTARYRMLPLLASCWGAVWATSSYYVGESFDQHVAMLSGVIVMVLALVLFVTEKRLSRGTTPLLARLSFVPLCVLLLAYAAGAASHLSQIRGPFMPGYSWDFAATLPPVSGELLALERTAQFRPDDMVIYPNETWWNKISSGLILPLERNADGSIRERTAWLPLSGAGEYNAWLTLPFPRRGVYIERYLSDSTNPQGWYITYRRPADCRQLSPRLYAVKHASSRNYDAVYCRMR